MLSFTDPKDTYRLHLLLYGLCQNLTSSPLASQTYFISLKSRPRSFVTVEISHEPSDFQMLFSPNILVFDAGTWNIPQVMTKQRSVFFLSMALFHF